MDIPGSLPIEIFHEILKYLSTRDLYNVRDCCKKWRYHMESFWKIKCIKEGYSETEDDLNSQFYQKFMERFSRWEGIYMYNNKLENNWLNLNFKEVVNRVDSYAGFVIQYFCGDVIIAYSINNKDVWIINAKTAVVEKRFEVTVPKGIIITNIYAVGKFENKLIVVLGTDILDKHGKFVFPELLNIKVWNIETEESLPSFKTESICGRIREVHICKNLIIFLLHPFALYLYNIKNHLLEYSRNGITDVCHDNDKIAMLYQTGTLVIIDLDYTELAKFICCDSKQGIIKMQMKGNYFVTICDSDTNYGMKACIWNIDTKTKLYEVEDVHPGNVTIYLHENRLCYLHGDPQLVNITFRLCRLDTGNCILELDTYVRTHSCFIMTRDVNNDRLVKLWSIKTGKLIADLRLPQTAPLIFLKKYFAADNFMASDFYKTINKSKIAYLYDDPTYNKWILRILDFEANIEL